MNIDEALSSGPRTSKEIQALLNVSQASVSRLVSSDSSVVQLLGKKPYRYAATRAAFGADDNLPIATIDSHGKTVPRATLRPLQPRSHLVIPLSGASSLLIGENQDGHFDGLPYYMDDARPQGFIGRVIAQNLSNQSEFYLADPDAWNEEQVGRYLIANGNDLPGDFLFGWPALNRLRNHPNIQSRKNYSSMADSTLAGIAGVSSAGGEQQKFTAFISEIDSHVIVKFSPKQDDLTSRRWRDILVTEYHALTVLTEFGFTAAETHLSEQSNRYFLESKRFDRHGRFGRSSMLSLRTVDAEFTGKGEHWTNVFNALHKQQLVSLFDAEQVEMLQLFGSLINNTDMHLGNLSVAMDGDRFSLLPAYDMCSMGFAPKGTEVTDLGFELPALEQYANTKSTWNVLNAAAEFWTRVENDDRTSNELRSFIAKNAFSQTLNKLTHEA